MSDRKLKASTWWNDSDWEREFPPERIAASAAEIRAGWTRPQEHERRGVIGEKPLYVPRIQRLDYHTESHPNEGKAE